MIRGRTKRKFKRVEKSDNIQIKVCQKKLLNNLVQVVLLN